jgi:hypothetical protein
MGDHLGRSRAKPETPLFLGLLLLVVANLIPAPASVRAGAPPEAAQTASAPNQVQSSLALDAGARSPEVSAVEPVRAGRGSLLKLRIAGKYFASGARVGFSNPGIRVLEVTRSGNAELAVRIQIASDAPAGTTSLYVVNPDDTEAEARFEVTEEPAVNEGEAAPGSTSTSTSSEPEPSASAGVASGHHFEVYTLGALGAILKSPGGAPRGTLTLTKAKLTYTESEKRVFSVRRSEIREIEPNTLLGLNTGTFHVILNSGKAYNFIAASLRPADGQSIVDALHRWLR